MHDQKPTYPVPKEWMERMVELSDLPWTSDTWPQASWKLKTLLKSKKNKKEINPYFMPSIMCWITLFGSYFLSF